MRIPVGLRVVVDIGSKGVDVRAIFVPHGVRQNQVQRYTDQIRVAALAVSSAIAEASSPEASKEGSLADDPALEPGPASSPKGGSQTWGLGRGSITRR